MVRCILTDPAVFERIFTNPVRIEPSPFSFPVRIRYNKAKSPSGQAVYAERRRVFLSKVVAVANQKGGVGKTTTTVNLASCVAEKGKRVLLVDMDPQGNATSGVGIDHGQVEKVHL